MRKVSMPKPDLAYLKMDSEQALYQLSVAELILEITKNAEGLVLENSSVAVDTGQFTGRSPKDRFIVYDEITKDAVFWGDVNFQFEANDFDRLLERMTAFLEKQPFYVRDGYACAHEAFKVPIRVITETAYQNLFAHHLFLRYTDFAGNNPDPGGWNDPEWTILAVPSFLADPQVDGTRQSNFSILNFTKKIILIGGTGYTGEIKKGIFSVLNFILPESKNVLPMHCSANVGKNGDTAIFFGLSGTGKTTLSADPQRSLIGDDEHGWTENAVFNFEGGCYAKCVDLTPEKEPQIFNAIKFGALLENVSFYPGTTEVDFGNISKTENTRVAYPLEYIENAVIPSVAGAPKNIFFLTADAFGVLPPISRLDTGQAMFHFISGYTAKVAGTEAGINEPQATFSACFGKAFLPLHPTRYASLLGEKLRSHGANVWLINTGWTGGPYGTGQRMKLTYTRAMISAALDGALDNSDYQTDPFFGLSIPLHCPGVPDKLLNPRNTWAYQGAYDAKAAELAAAFRGNFKAFEAMADAEILSAMPGVNPVKTHSS